MLEREPPPELAERMEALRRRLRETYLGQMRLRIGAVLGRCRAYGVRLVVFPEYSVPWQRLEEVVQGAGEMVVVAGTHSVDRAARKSGLYERLGAEGGPGLNQAVCPVLYRGRLLGLQAKLSPAEPEKEHMEPGGGWAPVELPEGLPGPMGILVCLDFLYRESGQHRERVGRGLERCRFLAVPSYTPAHSLPEFAAKAWEEARRYGRPVLYADVASVSANVSKPVAAGGSSIFVDEGSVTELRRFPEQVGYLEPGDEGVIVADVDLGYVTPGRSTRYGGERPVRPFAEASLVYRQHPASAWYARWLEESAEVLEREGDDAVEEVSAHIEGACDGLLSVAALGGGGARGRRLRRLVREHGESVSRMETFRRYLREVVLPAEALPLPALRAAMAGAASDAIFAWSGKFRGYGLEDMAERLRQAGAAGERVDAGEWSEEGRAALGAVRRAIREAVPREEPRAPEVVERRLLPEGIDPATLGERKRDGMVLRFRARVEDVVSRKQRMELQRWQHAKRALAEEGLADDLGELSLRGIGEPALRTARELQRLALAEGCGRVAILAVEIDGADKAGLAPLAAAGENGWELWIDREERWWREHAERVRAALVAEGFGAVGVQHVSRDEWPARLAALSARFGGAAHHIEAYRALRLRDVNGAFVEPRVRVGDEEQPGLAALDAWLAGAAQTALVLGEFGSGKSTLLAEWCWRHREAQEDRPLLVNLAEVAATADPEAMLLHAAGLEDTPRDRAALRLLIEARRLLPCFDGFDEMATRMGAGELGGRLGELLRVAEGGGKVLLSSRDHYFETERSLESATTEALQRALGAAAGLVRLHVLPFGQEEVRGVVQGVFQRDEKKVEDALRRITSTYDLADLVQRPLLLAMVLQSLERIAEGVRIAPADVYEAYLRAWLAHTREDEHSLTHEQKIRFAEALAEELWRSGAPSCSWEELQQSVLERIGRALPQHLPLSASFLDVQGGAFFVREGEERYRFAHKSFLEYFLARALVGTLPQRPAEALATKPLTPEVASFVAEVLRQRGGPWDAAAIRRVQEFLKKEREPAGSSGAAADRKAASNAVRLLHRLGTWAGEESGLIPEGADLRGVDLVNEDLRGVRLIGARLGSAGLSGVDLTKASLRAADLEKAQLVGARLDGAELCGIQAHETDFTMASGEGCDFGGAQLVRATLRQSVWVGASWNEARLVEAETTAGVFVGAGAIAAGISPRSLEAVLPADHLDAVHCVALSSDGRCLVSAGEDRTMCLWDATSGTQLRLLQGHEDRVWSVAFAPDGRRLVSAGTDRTVRLWDAASGAQLRLFQGHEGWVWSVAFAPDGKRLVSAGEDLTIRLWDAESGVQLRILQGYMGSVNSVAFAPDGRRLVSAGLDRTIRLWDAASGMQLRLLQGHEDRVRSVAFAPDGKRLVSAGLDRTVRLWDAASGAQLRLLQGHEDRVFSVAFAPDGRRLVSAGADGTVCLWDAESGEQLRLLQGHEASVSSVAFAPDGRRLVSASDDGTVRLWDAQSGALLCTFMAIGHDTLARTPGGFCHFGEGDGSLLRLAVRHPDHPRTYLPLGGLRAVLDRPDKVAAALSGDLSGDDLGPELAARGWDVGKPWDGQVERITTEPSAAPPPPATPPTASIAAALPQNPFRPGPALLDVEALPGREPVVHELLSLARSRSPAVLIGPRRTGKTSLLGLLERRLAASHAVHRVTLEGKKLHTADDLARVLLPMSAPPIPTHGRDTAPRPSEALRAHLAAHRTVFLIDEVAHLHQAEGELFAYLRALGQESAALVLAGSPLDWVNIVRRAAAVAPGSSFGNDVTPVVLGPLSEPEAVGFLVETAPAEIPEPVARWVVELCGAWPFYLQVLGHALYEAHHSRYRAPFVDRLELRKLYEQRLLVERRTAFEGRWQELPPQLRTLLREHRERRPILRQLPHAYRRLLVDAGLGSAAGDWLADRPFFEWIQLNADLLGEEAQ